MHAEDLSRQGEHSNRAFDESNDASDDEGQESNV